MMDYEIYYKRKFALDQWPNDHDWDIFISAYNSSERVRHVFQKVTAGEKHWLIFPQYEYGSDDYPDDGKIYPLCGDDESEYIQSYLDFLHQDLAGTNICIDITGFIRPHLMFLLRRFMQEGVKKFDALYSEPSQYMNKERTVFSGGGVTEVRQVMGFEGTPNPDTTNDLLIIGSGYDSILISHVAEDKAHADKIQLFGLPSLRPDMYQENILRAKEAGGDIGGRTGDELNSFFAPAYDPFVTASVLKDIVDDRKKITNLYLCPLATKPQTLGFALYFLKERRDMPTSIIYPFSRTYSRETSIGIARIWQYTVELPSIND